MSNFACEHCGAVISDSPRGYVTGCPHYPMEMLVTAGRGRDVTPPDDTEKAKSRQLGLPSERLPEIVNPHLLF